MFKKILVAFDGSDAGKRAFETALDLAQKYEAELILVSVIEDLPRYAEETMNGVDEMMEQGQKHFEFLQRGLISEAKDADVKISALIQPGHVVETIVTKGEELKADLIVLGGAGHSGFFRRLASLTGIQIAYHAAHNVLIVR